MRTRDPKHENQFHSLAGLPAEQLIERIGVRLHTDARHVHSEVLATIVRNRFGQAKGVVTAAVEELNARIQILVGSRMRGLQFLPSVQRLGNTALEETIGYVWLKFYEDQSQVSNSEVRFAVFVRDRVDDFVRHLGAGKNSIDSIEDVPVVDPKTGEKTPLLDTLEDTGSEKPEESLMRKQQSQEVHNAMMALPKNQRMAFYLRAEFDYEWEKVAEVLKCSVTHARKLYQQARETLQGALK